MKQVLSPCNRQTIQWTVHAMPEAEASSLFRAQKRLSCNDRFRRFVAYKHSVLRYDFINFQLDSVRIYKSKDQFTLLRPRPEKASRGHGS
jgi:hypothetical protein